MNGTHMRFSALKVQCSKYPLQGPFSGCSMQTTTNTHAQLIILLPVAMEFDTPLIRSRKSSYLWRLRRRRCSPPGRGRVVVPSSELCARSRPAALVLRATAACESSHPCRMSRCTATSLTSRSPIRDVRDFSLIVEKSLSGYKFERENLNS